MRLVRLAMSVMVLAGCHAAPGAGTCSPERVVEVWSERRFPAARAVTDTASATLSLALAHDPTSRPPRGGMLSMVIAGPATAARPDTIRLLTSIPTDRRPLWHGDGLRPGTYTASLTTPDYAITARPLALAAGERAEVELSVRRTAACDSSLTSADLPAR